MSSNKRSDQVEELRAPYKKVPTNSRTLSFLLNCYEPRITWRSTITFYFLTGLAALAYGLFVASANSEIIEIEKRYDEICTGKLDCSITITLTELMKQPILVQYGIDNFHQNHRIYMESFSLEQLEGQEISQSEAIKRCSPAVTNQDLGKTKSWGGLDLEPTAVASPCGMKAKFYFNDEFQLWNKTEQIPLAETDIAYPKGGDRFARSSTSEKTQWIQPDNEHFVVWMTPASLSSFRKPWAKLDKDLMAGEYIIKIRNNYDATQFNGKKYVILTTANVLGGKSTFLSFTFFIAGVIMLLIAIFFSGNSDLA